MNRIMRRLPAIYTRTTVTRTLGTLASVSTVALLFCGNTSCDPATTGTTGAAPASSGINCDPKGFGPLSGCDTGGDQGGSGNDATLSQLDGSPFCQTHQALSCVLRGPGGSDDGPTYVVTKKYRSNDNDGESCVESRVPHDVHDRFDRTCIPDDMATAADREWYANQHVGQPVWRGGAS